MGTRGVWGFYYKKEDKLTYNHYDSYPEGLGNKIREFLTSHSVTELKKIATKIELVDGRSTPTDKQIEACANWTDLNVSNQSTTDWYCLLREAQFNPSAYATKLKYMIDSKDFIKDSLFCEYAYIINLDTEKLEIYVGFQKTPQKNRYIHTPAELKKLKEDRKKDGYKDDDEPYYNCKLQLEIPLSEIKNFSMEQFQKTLQE